MKEITLSKWIEYTRELLYKDAILCILDNIKRNAKLELLNQLENDRENIKGIY